MRKSFSLASLCLFLQVVCHSQSVPASNEAYIVEDSVLIRTRDGAQVSALVVRKKGVVKKLPAIFQFTIYARTTDIKKVKEAADSGYVGVMAYTRGKRYSPEAIVPYEYDGNDAYDVIDWISKQEWSNGEVGMYGGSYNGFTQWASTKRLHPALKTIVPSASCAPGLDVPMTNNVSMSFVFPWTYYVGNNKWLDNEDYNSRRWDSLNWDWFSEGRSYRALDTMAGRPGNRVFQRWLDHPSYDTYWQQMIPYRNEFAQINMPVLTTTGYYDGGQIGATYYLREHLRYNTTAEHYLLIGPYGHFGCQGYPDSIYKGYTIDSVANIPIHSIIYDWFGYVFKGAPKPSILKDRINYQVMGTNEWKHVASLDKMGNDSLVFYLGQRRKDSTYSLQTTPGKKFIPQEVDFADRSTRNSYFYANNIIYDNIYRDNGIVLMTDPLQKDMEISGRFSGNLQAIINKKDMDCSAVLFELMPNGEYFYLSYFMGRASYSAGPETRTLWQPGKIGSFVFTNTYITSRKLSKGSRIVVLLNVNKSPFEQINYGTGKPVSAEDIHDADVPLKIKWLQTSYFTIPVVK